MGRDESAVVVVASALLGPRATSPGPYVVYAVGDVGTGAAVWKAVRRRLQDQVDLFAARLPGRESRFAEAPLDTVAAQVDDVYAAVGARLRTDTRPYGIAGVCSGATVAYELARRLETAGVPPVVLFAVSQHTPSTPPDKTATRRSAQTADELFDWLAGQGHLPDGTKVPELLGLAERMLRADFRAVESYRHRPEPVLRCPVVGVVGRDDPAMTETDIGRWAQTTAGPYRSAVVVGAHRLLREAPVALADVISATMAEVAVQP